MSKPVSVVIATREIDDKFLQHVGKMFSHPKTEIIVYENEGEFGLAELYNRGLAEASADIVVFMHDDIEINTKNLNNKINRLFERNPEFGIVGVLGTTEVLNGAWWSNEAALTGRVHLQTGDKKTLRKFSKESHPDKPKEVVCVDGMFIAVNRPKLKALFDIDFKGFHHHDVSFCVANFNEGVKIGVTAAIKLTHKSTMKIDNAWENSRNLFVDKYSRSISVDKSGKTIKSSLDIITNDEEVN
jgi:GT2 family glycosyltransferase